MSPILSAALIEPFLDSALYGIYFVVFSTVVYLFWHKPGLTKRPMIFVFMTLVFQFLTVSADWINAIYGTYLPFVRLGGGLEAERFYETTGNSSRKIHILLSEVTNTVTDCLVIYRLYVVWNHNVRIVAFALALLVGQIISGIGGVYRVFIPSQFKANYHSSSIGWITANLATSLLISAYSTGMMSWKILRLSRMVQESSIPLKGRRRLTSILGIMIESAALQTAMNAALLVALQFVDALATYFILKGIQAVVLSLSTVLIYARIGLGWTKETTMTPSDLVPVSFVMNVMGSRDAEEG